MSTTRALLAVTLASLLSGCGSADWTMRVADTPENWAGLQGASKRQSFKVTYVREREFVTKRRVAMGMGIGPGTGQYARVAAKRRGEWIYFCVEAWDRAGVGLGQAWTLKGNNEEMEKKVLRQLTSEPGVKVGTIDQVYREDGWPLDEDTVEVPDDAPEYSETEDFSLD
jgi:hypothetical protein